MESYPKFHNEVGVPIVRIGCREFKCIGDKPPQDHPHIYLNMGDASEIGCPYCSTLFRFDPSLGAHEAKLIRQIVLTVTWTKLKSSNAVFHATSTDTAHAQDFDLLRYSSQRWRSQCVSIDATTSVISARWHGGDCRGPSSITSMARRTMRSRIGEIPKPTSGAIWCPTFSRVSKASTCR